MQKECLALGAGVAYDISQVEGQLMYRCQGPNCSKKNEGRWHVSSLNKYSGGEEIAHTSRLLN